MDGGQIFEPGGVWVQKCAQVNDIEGTLALIVFQEIIDDVIGVSVTSVEFHVVFLQKRVVEGFIGSDIADFVFSGLHIYKYDDEFFILF